jgi:hypothetical protein
MSSLTSTLGSLTLETGGATRSYAEGVKVSFKGQAHGEALSGYFICAFHVFKTAQSLASYIAVKLGLGPELAVKREGVENVLAELLNIIIGLTSSDWAKHGLEIVFDPPEKLGGHLIDPIPEGSAAYHLTLSLPEKREIAIFLNFLFQSKEPS